MFTVSIRKDRLIDLLEKEFGDVYQQMSGEEDTILSVKNDYTEIEITIGNPDEEV